MSIAKRNHVCEREREGHVLEKAGLRGGKPPKGADAWRGDPVTGVYLVGPLEYT